MVELKSWLKILQTGRSDCLLALLRFTNGREKNKNKMNENKQEGMKKVHHTISPWSDAVVLPDVIIPQERWSQGSNRKTKKSEVSKVIMNCEKLVRRKLFSVTALGFYQNEREYILVNSDIVVLAMKDSDITVLL